MSENSQLLTIDDFRLHKNDTGSAYVQSAILTNKVKSLSSHCSLFKNDAGAKIRLVQCIETRRKLLAYIKNKDKEPYAELIKKLGLRK